MQWQITVIGKFNINFDFNHGDVNIGNIDWNCSAVAENVAFHANYDMEYLLFEFLTYHNLNQIMYLPNDN